jgi:hypothetical protein
MFTSKAADGMRKIRLEPEIALEDSYGFSPRELSTILSVVAENRERPLRAWDDHFADGGPI